MTARQVTGSGNSVALSGDTAVLGAHGDDAGAADAGAAYVFVRSGTTWTQQRKLTASDGLALSYFGRSVAVSGDSAIVGAYLSGAPQSGAAYVFTRSGTTWTQQQKLLSTDIAAGDRFGYSVALSGDTALVGAHGADAASKPDAGAAYAFTRTGTSWTQQSKLTASDAEAGDHLGDAVALSGDTAIVGASTDDVLGRTDSGSAYTFTRSGTMWIQQTKLVPVDGAAGDSFGYSVAISGARTVVGARDADVSGRANQGAVYVFSPYTTPRTPRSRSPAPGLLANDKTTSRATRSPPRWSHSRPRQRRGRRQRLVHRHPRSRLQRSRLLHLPAAWDGTVQSSHAVVAISATPVNDAPVAVANGPYMTPEDTAYNLNGPGLLTNDSDAEGDPLTAFKVTDPTHGSVVVNPNGGFVYTPAVDYFGADSFTYRVFDGTAYSNVVAVTLNVTPVNDPPVAVADGAVAKLLAADGAEGRRLRRLGCNLGRHPCGGRPGYNDVGANAEPGLGPRASCDRTARGGRPSRRSPPPTARRGTASASLGRHLRRHYRRRCPRRRRRPEPNGPRFGARVRALWHDLDTPADAHRRRRRYSARRLGLLGRHLGRHHRRRRRGRRCRHQLRPGLRARVRALWHRPGRLSRRSPPPMAPSMTCSATRSPSRATPSSPAPRTPAKTQHTSSRVLARSGRSSRGSLPPMAPQVTGSATRSLDLRRHGGGGCPA